MDMENKRMSFKIWFLMNLDDNISEIQNLKYVGITAA